MIVESVRHLETSTKMAEVPVGTYTSSGAALTSASTLSRVEATIMGESALIDRETGRVFWEGGASTTLTESIFATKLDQFGAEHAQAALLTVFITIAFLGILGAWLRRILNVPSPVVTGESSSQIVNYFHLLLSYTLFRIPHPENKWLVGLTIALYLLESYNCNTRRFLANAIVRPKWNNTLKIFDLNNLL